MKKRSHKKLVKSEQARFTRLVQDKIAFMAGHAAASKPRAILERQPFERRGRVRRLDQERRIHYERRGHGRTDGWRAL